MEKDRKVESIRMSQPSYKNSRIDPLLRGTNTNAQSRRGSKLFGELKLTDILWRLDDESGNRTSQLL